jgi:hypothetical protein
MIKLIDLLKEITINNPLPLIPGRYYDLSNPEKATHKWFKNAEFVKQEGENLIFKHKGEYFSKDRTKYLNNNRIRFSKN